MKNILTIDVEDWRQIVSWKLNDVTLPPSPNVVVETQRLLATLAAHRAAATFFVLSNVAATYPELIREIDRAGHEIASHGWSHSIVYRQTPAEFRAETRRAKHLLEQVIGKPVYGYRAAEFSIVERSQWALDILADEGFTFDSSIYPIPGRRYGIPGFSLAPCCLQTGTGRRIIEFPLTAIERWGRRWPVAGGGYFRLLPYPLTRAAVRNVNQHKRPAVTYFHPYEFATSSLRVPLAGPLPRCAFMFVRYMVVHNLARAQMVGRFERLLRDFEFVPIRELIASVPTD